MIITSSHKAWNSSKYRTIAISGNRGKDANYEGEAYPALAPKKEMWKLWESCRNIPNYEDRNNNFYIENYYFGTLAKLDPLQVLNELDNSVLLCYEPSNEFCHRHIIAAWFEILLNEEVVEAKCNGDEIEYLEKSPYYEKIKKQLEIVMRQKDMHGFRSLRACYLYEKGEQEELAAQNLRKQANELDDLVTKAEFEVPIAIHLTEANRLKEEAEVVELEYCNSYGQISLHKTNPKFTPKITK